MTHLGQMVRRDCRRCGHESLSDGVRCLLCNRPLKADAPAAPAPVDLGKARADWPQTAAREPDGPKGAGLGRSQDFGEARRSKP